MPLDLASFEGDFQAFMRGAYSRCFDEDVERDYAQRAPYRHPLCVHGKTRMGCNDCYINGWRPKW